MKSLKRRFLFDEVASFDCETTSVNTDEAEIIEISIFKELKMLSSGFIKPSSSIPIMATSVNNITNKMVADSKPMEEQFDNIYNMVNCGAKYYAAHNASFDMAVVNNLFKRYGKEPLITKENTICTFRLAKHIFNNDPSIESYKQQYLRYAFEFDLDDVTSHRSADDSIVCFNLLDELTSLAIEKNLIDPSKPYGEQLVKLSWKHINIIKMPFGKHKGKLFTDIIKEESDYFEFLIVKANDGNGMNVLNENHPDYDDDLAQSIFQFVQNK